MALIQCPECSQQVSTEAAACPNCGAPVAAAREAEAAGAQLTTTQLTSKKLKTQQLISVFMVIIGAVWAISSAQSGGDSGLPALIAFAGLIWFVVVRIRTWWHHG